MALLLENLRDNFLDFICDSIRNLALTILVDYYVIWSFLLPLWWPLHCTLWYVFFDLYRCLLYHTVRWIVIELQTPWKAIVKVCLEWISKRRWQHLTVAGSRAWGVVLTRKDVATMICGVVTSGPIGILVRRHHCARWLHLGRKALGGFYVLNSTRYGTKFPLLRPMFPRPEII